MKRFTLGLLTAAIFACSSAFAGMLVEDSNKKVLGFAAKIGCGLGLTCTINGAKVNITGPGANGQPLLSGAATTLAPFAVTATTGVGTSTTPSATTLYLIQVFVPFNMTLTGVALNNAATCGTNNYIVALYDASGNKLANSATAGTLCSGTSAWQKIPFTATKAITGPAIYFVGLFVDGTTDRFYTVPAAGAYVGVAGTVTGQTFGTVGASVTLPTTFTADKGPIVYTY